MRLTGDLTLCALARACYVCKQPYTNVHRYYDSMCQSSGDFNYAKCEPSANLAGRYALVTAARVKIGYQASLKLLRAGASVVVTTRFPVDAAERYAQQPDYAALYDRLQIHGVDLRHTPSVELFARWLGERLPWLDFISNNACQTVRRPAGFFRHLLAREAEGTLALPAAMHGPLAQHAALCQSLIEVPDRSDRAVLATATRGDPEGQVHSAALSQRHYLDEDYLEGAALNMMKRTSAPDYVRDGIHMTAVDTGWVTDEDPAVHAARKAEQGFAPPLDIIDGAAPIVDPIFSGINNGTHVWGQFLKDYTPAPW